MEGRKKERKVERNEGKISEGRKVERKKKEGRKKLEGRKEGI